MQNFMLVQCSDSKHKSCGTIQKMIKQLPSVYETYKTRFVQDGKIYCIAAKAVTTRVQLNDLKRSINEIHDEKHNLRVTSLKMYHS